MSESLDQVVLLDGCRTPFVRSNTHFRDLTSYDLARTALKALVIRTDLPAEAIDFVAMGSVVQNVHTTNVAREAALAAGIPAAVPAHTVTMACISGNRACTTALDAIRTGNARFAVVGGTESLSDVPILLRKALRSRLIAARRAGGPLDYLRLIRGLRPSDLLPESPAIAEYSTGKTMGESGEELAALYGVSRSDQDAYALASHQRAHAAQEAGHFDRDLVPVMIEGADEPIDRDNGIRPDTSLERLAALKPAFVKPQGTLTAGNSTFLTDGASAALVASEAAADERGLRPLARFGPHVFVAQAPDAELLLGPAFAIPRVLHASGLTLRDIDVFEIHEAFAGQLLAVLRALSSADFARKRLGWPTAVGEIPMDRLNAWGGSLAIGHPFGATGVRLLTTAARRLVAEDGRYALVAACAAGGLGTAMLLERHPKARRSETTAD